MARNNTRLQKERRAQATHCAYCLRPLNGNATFDHFYPLCKDVKNLNRPWNKLIVCEPCNTLKKAKMPAAFAKWCTKQIFKGKYPAKYLKNISLNVSRYQNELEGYFIMRDLI